MVEIPADGLLDTRFESLARSPIELPPDARGVDRIALVVSRAIGHEGDLIGIGGAICAWGQPVESRAHGTNDLDILFFVMTADIVAASGFPAL